MPTFETTQRFKKDFADLSDESKERFKAIVTEQFVLDLVSGRFRPGLRVKGVQGAPNIMEMTWAPDGRATWQYGEELTDGVPHVIWRRVGTHDIFKAPA